MFADLFRPGRANTPVKSVVGPIRRAPGPRALIADLTLSQLTPRVNLKNVLGPISLYAALGCAPDRCKKCCWTYSPSAVPTLLQRMLLDLFRAARISSFRRTGVQLVADLAPLTSRRKAGKCTWIYPELPMRERNEML